MKKIKLTIFLLLFVYTAFAQVNLKNGLVAHYTLDGHAADSSGNGLNGKMLGTSPEVSRFNRPSTCLRFDGNTDAVAVAHSNLLNLTADKSISVWYKIETTSGFKSYPGLVYKFGITDYPTFGIVFAEDAGYGTSRYKVDFLQGSGSGTNKQNFTKQLYTNYVNQWVHIVASYSTSDGYMRVYFNGVISDSVSIGNFSSNVSTDSMQIGRGNKLGYPSGHYKGLLDDIRIYNRPLTKQEVLALYNEKLTVYSQKKRVICQGDSVLAGGKYRKLSDFYYDTIAINSFVDSVVVTELTVNPTYLVPQTTTICNGGKIFLGGKYQTLAGDYYDSLKTAKGCDSVIKTTLIVNPAYYLPKTIQVCDGDSVLAGGKQRKSTGTYYDSLLTAKGCDSTIVTTVIVNPNYFAQYTYEICQGDSLLAGSKYRKTAGTYYDSLHTTKGCDSVIKTILKINPVYFFNRTAIICSNDSIFLGSKYRNTPGLYYDTLHTRKGCDSIKITSLIVNPAYKILKTVEICDGDSLLIAGSYRSMAGIYTENHVSIKGCDSIIETTLKINPEYFSSTFTLICAGDSIYFDGKYIKTTGTYYDSLKTTKGCDSVVEKIVLVNTIITTVSKNSYVLVAQESGASYQWLNCTTNTAIAGETQQSFIATTNGNYAVVITKNSCRDTSICYAVTTLGTRNVITDKIAVYPNPAKDLFTVELAQNYKEIKVSVYTVAGQHLATYSELNTNTININSYLLPAGVYLLEIIADGKQQFSKVVIE